VGVALVLGLALGCGGRSLSQEQGDSERGGTTAGTGGTGTALGGNAGAIGGVGGGSGSGGTIVIGGGTSCGGPILPPDPDSIPLDASDCASRPQGDCAGIVTCYSSNSAFIGAPALADCSRFIPFDGCRDIVISFDVDGCATSVSPGESGWDGLDDLRICLGGVFAGGRFECLGASTFRFDESCFID
jgi:hypothetical protein